MQKYKYFFFTFLLVLFELTSLYAPPGGSWNPGDTEPTVPIHGGLLFFIVGALIYFIRKQIIIRKK